VDADGEQDAASDIQILSRAGIEAELDLGPHADLGVPAAPEVMPSEGRTEPDSADWEDLFPVCRGGTSRPLDRNIQRKLALAYYNLGRLNEALAIYESLLEAEEDPCCGTAGQHSSRYGRHRRRGRSLPPSYRRDSALAPPTSTWLSCCGVKVVPNKALRSSTADSRRCPKSSAPPCRRRAPFSPPVPDHTNASVGAHPW
jgi:hypothetical protein